MLHIVLSGLRDGTDEEQLTTYINHYTTTQRRAVRAQVGRLQEGDTIIIAIEAASLQQVLHEVVRLGVVTADMWVGQKSE